MKMKKVVLGVVAMLLASSAAIAADYGPPTYGPPPARLGVYSWTGPYVGANLGYLWGTTTNNGTEPSGVQGGLQAGYNWQYGQFVFGGETDIQFTGADDTFAAWKFSNPWFGTLRARAGIALNNVLFYGTAGFAYGRVRGENLVLGVTEGKVHGGWVLGGGMEVGLTPNWTARAEYLYVDLNNRGYSLTGTDNGLESSILRLGVNYRF